MEPHMPELQVMFFAAYAYVYNERALWVGLGLVAFSDFIAHTPREPLEWLFTVSSLVALF